MLFGGWGSSGDKVAVDDDLAVKVGVPVADLAAALFSANAILAALFVRDRTGMGQQIDVSLLEAAIALEAWKRLLEGLPVDR